MSRRLTLPQLKKAINFIEVVNNLTKQENYEEKMQILEVTSPTIENSISKLVEDAVKNATSEEDLELVTSIVEKSKGTMGDKIINSANQNEASKEKITKIIVKIVEKNPEKALEIINKNYDIILTNNFYSFNCHRTVSISQFLLIIYSLYYVACSKNLRYMYRMYTMCTCLSN